MWQRETGTNREEMEELLIGKGGRQWREVQGKLGGKGDTGERKL